MNVATSSFRAMNTDVAVLAPLPQGQIDRVARTVRSLFAEVERCLSRFRQDSELSRLNRKGARPFPASPLLFHAVSLSLDAAAATDGVFDPTVLDALEGAGYDRSFEEVKASGTSSRTVNPPNYRDVVLNRERGTITLAHGQRLDLGGIGKGLAVNLAMKAAAEVPDLCVNAGGDLETRGCAGAEPWTAVLEDSGTEGPVAVSLHSCALATSTVTRRRWSENGGTGHHLIDTGTARPSLSPFRTVTVVAGDCIQADVAAKTALLLGEAGIQFLEEHGLHGFAVRHDGSVQRTYHWPWRAA